MQVTAEHSCSLIKQHFAPRKNFTGASDSILGGVCLLFKLISGNRWNEFHLQVQRVWKQMPILILSYSVSHTGSGNFTSLSGMLFTTSTLKESLALCSLDFNLSIGMHLCVNAQSTMQSLCVDRYWRPVGLYNRVLPLIRGFLWVQIETAVPKRGFSWLPEVCQVSCCLWGSPNCSHLQLPGHWPGLTTSSHSAVTLLPPQAAFGVRNPRMFS